MNEKKKIDIDIAALLKIILQDKRQLIIWCIVASVFAVVYAFSIPRIYTSSVTLTPESSSGNNLSSGISSLASMVGVNLQVGGGYDAIYPEIYPDLMGSKDFQVSMFDTKVKSLDGEINTTYYDYLNTKQKGSWVLYPIVMLKQGLAKLTTPPDNAVGGQTKIDPKRLSRRQYELADAVGKQITCAVDKKTSIITITATAQDPSITVQLVDSAQETLQYYITEYRTKKARNDVEYMEKLFAEAKADYTKARQLYASYSEANQDLLLASFRAKQEDLENEMQLKYNIYTQVANQLQLTRAKLQERTPAFTVIQTASMPYKHNNKPKIVILMTFLFFTVCLRLLILVIRNRKQILHFNFD